MPRQIDHDARREELAAALWRLVLREGIEAASIRRVAAEAGWSTGSLRHYFATQGELLAFAMRLVTERVRARIAGGPPATAAELLEHVLPLDDERRAEMQVWLAFTMQALVDAALRPLLDETHAALRGVCHAATGDDAAAARLHAFVDGLALHAVLDPAGTTPARMRKLLALQLG